MRERKTSGNSIARAAFVAVSLLFQVGWLLLLILELNEYSARISLITSLLSVAVVLLLIVILLRPKKRRKKRRRRKNTSPAASRRSH